jgi:hypothetical protein
VRLTESIQSIALIEMEPVDGAGRNRVCRSPSVGARCIWIAVLTIFDPESTGLPDVCGTAEYMKGLVKANVKNDQLDRLGSGGQGSSPIASGEFGHCRDSCRVKLPSEE